MAQLAGKYIFDKEENIVPYLTALGLNEEKVKGALAANKEVEIKVEGTDYTISSVLGSRTFPLNKEIDEPLPDGIVLKSTASVSGDKLIIKSNGSDGKKGERVYEKTNSGLILITTTEGVGSAKIYYNKA